MAWKCSVLKILGENLLNTGKLHCGALFILHSFKPFFFLSLARYWKHLPSSVCWFVYCCSAQSDPLFEFMDHTPDSVLSTCEFAQVSHSLYWSLYKHENYPGTRLWDTWTDSHVRRVEHFLIWNFLFLLFICF